MLPKGCQLGALGACPARGGSVWPRSWGTESDARRSASLHNHRAAVSLVKLIGGGGRQIRSDLLVGHPHQQRDIYPLQQQEAEIAGSGDKAASPVYFLRPDIPILSPHSLQLPFATTTAPLKVPEREGDRGCAMTHDPG